MTEWYVLAPLGLLTLLAFLGYAAYRKGRPDLAKRKDEFSCKSCTNCCRFNILELLDEDVERIEALGFSGFYKEKRGSKIMRNPNGMCFFLDGVRCRIYPHRPDACRNFPFYEFGPLELTRIWPFCPGLLEMDGKGD